MNLLNEKFEGRGSQKGFSFEQIKRTEKVAMYKKSDKNDVYYEVFKIPVAKERMFLERLLPEGEVYPGDNGFGKHINAICTASLERAEEYYNELTNEVGIGTWGERGGVKPKAAPVAQIGRASVN